MGYELGLTAMVQTTLSARLRSSSPFCSWPLGAATSGRRKRRSSIAWCYGSIYSAGSWTAAGSHSKPRIRLEPGPRHSRTGRH